MKTRIFKENRGMPLMENTNVFIKESRDFTKPEVLESIKSKKLFEDVSHVEKAYLG